VAIAWTKDSSNVYTAKFLGLQLIRFRSDVRILLRALLATDVCLISRGRLTRVFDPAPDQGDGLPRV
jgi:hypothetical protein